MFGKQGPHWVDLVKRQKAIEFLQPKGRVSEAKG
jgi:hypothetical protein